MAGVVVDRVDIDKILKGECFKIIMRKRGQVTIFIIIAVIIVAAVSLYFIFRESFNVEEPVYIESTQVYNFVQECIDQTLEGTIVNVSRQGGYSGYTYLEKTNEEGTTYYILDGKNYMPSKKRVETEISKYFERKFFLCTRHFIDFPEYRIEEGLLETSIEINNENVFLRADYPLTIRKEKDVSRFEDFESEIDVRLGIVYDSVYDFIQQQRNYEEGICLSCLDLAIENEIYIEMKNDYNKTVTFIFKDDFSELNNEPLEWVFANEH